MASAGAEAVSRSRNHLPLHDVVAGWDYCRLVPDWSLFAGPAHPDYRLVLRVVRPDGVMSDWEPVEVWAPKPSGAFLWHPQLTARMIVGDLSRNHVHECPDSRLVARQVIS